MANRLRSSISMANRHHLNEVVESDRAKDKDASESMLEDDEDTSVPIPLVISPTQEEERPETEYAAYKLLTDGLVDSEGKREETV
mmetsp:Transcript_40559/g.65809  ORF Transcript_40559/g.65809 Transcript_40559/m.65809 type:complete len:85 (-) Transcript_40559:519-773(-)